MRAILTFHSVDDAGTVLSYSPEHFEALISGLAARGLPIVDLPTLLAPNCVTGVALTFDDGMASVLEHALPVLTAHEAPAHLFLSTAPIDTPMTWPAPPTDIPPFEMLTWDAVERLVAGGVLIEGHTHTHPDLRTISAAQMEDECGACDDRVEARVGRRPRYFAYPFGYFDDNSVAVARRLYDAAVTTELRALAVTEDPALLPRLDTFYLQTPDLIERFDTPAVQTYLAMRSFLRSVRGTQVIPERGVLAAARRAFRQ